MLYQSDCSFRVFSFTHFLVSGYTIQLLLIQLFFFFQQSLCTINNPPLQQFSAHFFCLIVVNTLDFSVCKNQSSTQFFPRLGFGPYLCWHQKALLQCFTQSQMNFQLVQAGGLACWFDKDCTWKFCKPSAFLHSIATEIEMYRYALWCSKFEDNPLKHV